ncbi:MAG: GNAT family N-acetyltransferase [Lactobacillus sp.]|jgi:RimJ/RimL family protein N-acetyltransferase|nr:GNAT family N-acetyltransferase [Lactobacillus sp.]MCI2031954.1 GNAT family N-acetyltransferase [Lactobacillus sp.]
MSDLQTGLTTARLTLRYFQPEDADDLFLLFQEPKTLRLTRYQGVQTRAEFDQVFTTHFLHNPTAVAIRYPLDGAVIGFIEMHTGGVLTYAIRQAFWNRGLVTEAGRAFVDAMFATQPITSVMGEFANENRASGRVLAKMGLHYVGEIGPFPKPDGEDTMVTQYAIQRDEWAARR